MRVRVETNKKEAIGVAPFLINYSVSAFCKNWRSYKSYDSTTNHICKGLLTPFNYVYYTVFLAFRQLLHIGK